MSQSLICSTLSRRCWCDTVWVSLPQLVVSHPPLESINSHRAHLFALHPSSPSSLLYFFSAWEESSLTHAITEIGAVFLHHTYPAMVESNFASWKAGCEIRSILHIPPGLVLHPCHISFQVIINTLIMTNECVCLSTFMNAKLVGRASG